MRDVPNRLINLKYDIEETFTMNKFSNVYWPKFVEYFGEWACCPPCFYVSLVINHIHQIFSWLANHDFNL